MKITRNKSNRRKVIAALVVASCIASGTGYHVMNTTYAVAGTQWQEYNHNGTSDIFIENTDHVRIDSNTQSMYFRGYGSVGYKDFMIYDDGQPYQKDITLTINEASTDWHTLEGGGFLINVGGSNSSKNGYLILFEKNGISLYQLNGTNIQQDNERIANVATKIASGAKNGSNHVLRLQTSPTHITVIDNGNVIINKDIQNLGGTGFGPYVSYTHHSCRAESRINFLDLKLKSQYATPNGIKWKEIKIGQGFDSTSPNVAANIANGNWNNSGTPINVSANDGESGADRIECPDGAVIPGANGTWIAKANGNYTFTGYDKEGNYAQATVAVNNIDTVAPSAGNISIQNKDGNGFDLVQSNTGDDRAGVGAVKFNVWTTNNGQDDLKTVDGVRQADGTWRAHISKADHGNQAGEYNAYANVYDNAGNKSDSDAVKTILDNTPPNIATQLDIPTGWTNKNLTVTVKATDAETGVSNITLPDGTVVKGDTATFTVEKNGVYTIKSMDNAGNVGTRSLPIGGTGATIAIDKNAPKLDLKYDKPNGWTNGDLVITANASDGESGIKSITLPDGKEVPGNTTTFNATQNGTYNFLTTDNAGNVTKGAITINEIDKSVPKIPTINGWDVTEDNKWHVVDVKPAVSTSSDGTLSGIKEVQYQIKDKANGTVIKDWATFTSGTSAISNEGISIVNYRTVTNAGTPSEPVATTVKLDKTKPNIKSMDITPDDSLRDGRDYRIDTDDSISGILKITLPDGTDLMNDISTKKAVVKSENKSLLQMLLPNANAASSQDIFSDQVSITIPKEGAYKAIVTDIAGNTNETLITVNPGVNTHRSGIIEDLTHMLDNWVPTNQTVTKDVINITKGYLSNPSYKEDVGNWNLKPATEDDLGRLTGIILVTDKQGSEIQVPFDKVIPKLIQTVDTALDRMKLHVGELWANNDTEARDMIDEMAPYILNPELKLDVKEFEKKLATEDEEGWVTGTYTVKDKTGKTEELPFKVKIEKLIQTVDSAKDRLLLYIGNIIVNNDTIDDDVLRQVKPYILNSELTPSITNFSKIRSTEDNLGLVKCDIVVKDKTGKSVVINFEKSINKLNQTLESARDRLTYFIAGLKADNDTTKDDIIKQVRSCLLNSDLDLDINDFKKVKSVYRQKGYVSGTIVIKDTTTGETAEVAMNLPIEALTKSDDYSKYLNVGEDGNINKDENVTKPEVTQITEQYKTDNSNILKELSDKIDNAVGGLPKTGGALLISVGSCVALIFMGIFYYVLREFRRKKK